MNPSPDPAARASRLCGECGLCCNGVLFERVQLQPGDSAKEISALGIRIKHKRQQPYFLQPCPAHSCSQCTIYEERPTRCREFTCEQLDRVERGEVSEETARENIRQAKRLADAVRELLLELGEKNHAKPLMARFRAVLDHPEESYLYPELKVRRAELVLAQEALATLVNREFYTVTQKEKKADLESI